MKYIFRGEKFIAMLISIAGSVGNLPYVVIVWEGFGTKLLHYLGQEIILPEVILNGLHFILLTWSILYRKVSMLLHFVGPAVISFVHIP